MTQQDSKYVTSSQPVNQRTASRQLLREQPLKPIVRERLLNIKARSKFGQPLVDQINGPDSIARPMPLGGLTIVGSIIGAVSFIGLLLAWIQSSLPFAAIALLGLLAGLGLVFHAHRSRMVSNLSAPVVAFFDIDTLRVFDAMFEKVAREVPESTALQLNDIKQQIVRISRQACTVTHDENFSMDDQMYLVECVRRYLPDTLQSYLLIPAEQRHSVVIAGQDTAFVVLGKQLTLIQTELQKRESKIAKNIAEKLLRQQRFLESKRS
jgi:hypothetical protein